MGIQPITILHTFQAIKDNLFLQEHLMLKEGKKKSSLWTDIIPFLLYLQSVNSVYIYAFILNKIKNQMSFLYFFLTMTDVSGTDPR